MPAAHAARHHRRADGRARLRPDPRRRLRAAEEDAAVDLPARARRWPAWASRRSACGGRSSSIRTAAASMPRSCRRSNAAIAEAERLAAAEPNARRSLVLPRRRLRRARAVPRLSRRAAGRRPRRQAHQGSARAGAGARSVDARCGVRHRHVSLLRRRGAGDLQVPALPAAAARRRSRRRARSNSSAPSRAGCWSAARRSTRSTCCISGTSTSRRRRSRSSAALQARYPHNPLFRQIEAEILDVYFHDHAASLKASEQLLALAQSRAVFRADIAERVARRNIARQAIALQQRERDSTNAHRHRATRIARRQAIEARTIVPTRRS